MATEALTAQVATRTGAILNRQSITTADGFTFPNNGRTLLCIANDIGALIVGFVPNVTVDGQTVGTRSVTITASEDWVLGPFPINVYNDADGLITCTVDADLATATAVVQF